MHGRAGRDNRGLRFYDPGPRDRIEGLQEQTDYRKDGYRGGRMANSALFPCGVFVEYRPVGFVGPSAQGQRGIAQLLGQHRHLEQSELALRECAHAHEQFRSVQRQRSQKTKQDVHLQRLRGDLSQQKIDSSQIGYPFVPRESEEFEEQPQRRRDIDVFVMCE
jgi:hypothetical protein